MGRAHEGNDTGVLITFSGLDGAGKSTLIEFLRTTLEGRRQSVVVLHLNDQVGVYAFLRAMRDRLLGRGRRPEPLAPGAPDPRSQKLQQTAPRGLRGALSRLRTAILWNKPVRRLLYPFDLMIFLCYRAYLERAQGRVLIMDRYFYDTLVDVTTDRRGPWTRLLEQLTPRPTVPVFLDITPEESFRRKREFSIEYLRHRSEAYRRVFARVPDAVRLVNDDLHRTKAALLEAVRARGGSA
jgi:thymidylate kinase